MIWQIKSVLSVFTLNRLQAGHWVRLDHHIVMNWAHVLVIVQCQSDGCNLSSKDGAVVWQSFGWVLAGCLTILEMVVDECSCPHPHSFWSRQCRLPSCDPLVTRYSLNLAWSSSLVIIHLLTPSRRLMSLRIVIMRSWGNLGCPQGADQFGIDLCRAHDFLYLETNRVNRGLRYAPSPIWPGDIKIFSGSLSFHAGHDVLDYWCRHGFLDSNAWIALNDVPPKELHWPLCTGWWLGWCKMFLMPVWIQSCGCCPLVVDLMWCHIQCNHSPAGNE